MKLQTYTLWNGHLPLIIDHGTKYPHDERARFRVANSTMTQGAFPYHAETIEEAERLATMHGWDGEKLEIQVNEIDL